MSRLGKRITAVFCTVCFLLTTAASAQSDRSSRIILMCCYQQHGWDNMASATFLDDYGYIWRYESAEPLPDTDEARLAFLVETDCVAPVGQIDFWRMLELSSLIESAQPWPLEPRSAVAVDFGSITYSAVRYSGDGSAELIPLAISGDWTAENPEPNAYALYVALFDEIAIHETAEPSWLQPMNIPREPLAAFFGLEEGIFEGATLAVSFFDPQLGELERMLDANEMQQKLDWLSGLVVTCKQNALPNAGHTCTYVLYSTRGEKIADFAFFYDLLVTADGMYAVELSDSQAQ